MTAPGWLMPCCACGQDPSQSFQWAWRDPRLVLQNRALCAVLQPEVSLLCDKEALCPNLLSQDRCHIVVAEQMQAALDLPNKDRMEAGLQADMSQEIGLFHLPSGGNLDLEAKGVVCHKLGRTAGVGYWPQGTERALRDPELWVLSCSAATAGCSKPKSKWVSKHPANEHRAAEIGWGLGCSRPF